jgi:thiamine biosynthesis lipoprotein
MTHLPGRLLRRLHACTIAGASVAAFACTPSSAPALRTAGGVAQGTTYSLQWVGGGTEAEIAVAVELELARIDALLSNYRADSALERFNAARSTEPAELPGELVTLLVLAKHIHGASAGCFDPTIRPLVRAWGFDAEAPAVPAPAAMEAARAAVGLDKLELVDSSRVRKSVPELEIDMASIGQGYTAGRLAALLEEHGSAGYLAEIGGEIVARGSKPDGSAWRVGIENPVAGVDPGPALRLPPSASTAVVTSGSYRQYFEVDGRRLGHIIDPRTGWPVEHALLSVTVVGGDAATAAAWGTALLCLGPAEAAAVAERENIAALFWVGLPERATLEISSALSPDWLDPPPPR